MTASPTAHVFWLFGLSGAGKSTLGRELTAWLRERSRPVLVLDGDRLRQGLCAGLGYDAAGRTENLRRAAETARLAVESDLYVVATFITPLESQRALVRNLVGLGHISLIHVYAKIDTCAKRDVKGLYASAQAGAVPRFTGVSDLFEPPTEVDLTVDTEGDSPAISAARLTTFAAGRLSA